MEHQKRTRSVVITLRAQSRDLVADEMARRRMLFERIEQEHAKRYQALEVSFGPKPVKEETPPADTSAVNMANLSEIGDPSVPGEPCPNLQETPASEPESTSFSVAGTLTDTGDGMQLRYEELAQFGMEHASTKLAFGYDNPFFVLMTRTGAIRSTMCFDGSGIRCMGHYETEFVDFDICTCTQKIENTLTWEGGRLFLQYTLEVRGLKSEFAQIEILIKPQPENSKSGKAFTLISDKTHSIHTCAALLDRAAKNGTISGGKETP